MVALLGVQTAILSVDPLLLRNWSPILFIIPLSPQRAHRRRKEATTLTNSYLWQLYGGFFVGASQIVWQMPTTFQIILLLERLL